jgi:hypothetical protein
MTTSIHTGIIPNGYIHPEEFLKSQFCKTILTSIKNFDKSKEFKFVSLLIAYQIYDIQAMKMEAVDCQLSQTTQEESSLFQLGATVVSENFRHIKNQLGEEYINKFFSFVSEESEVQPFKQQ